ncbi:MAG: sulfatase [Deltaproteobacteria bacterium]|nr:sulfatase [Deltaproteobacteria bacterium]
MVVQRKNVILITIDVLRKDMLGCYGNDKGLTPFIDSLAEKSTLFTRMQATGPYTQASFPGILTSSYYLEYGKPTRLSTKRTIVSEVLKKGGITTVGFHSNPYLSEAAGWNRGWDVFYDSMQDDVEPMLPYIRGEKINEKTIKWLNSYVEGDYKPFFLWVHYMDVHEPYVPEREFVDMVYPEISMNKDAMFDLFKNYIIKQNVSNPEKVQLLKQLYEIHVREADTYVETLFKALEDKGVLKDSVVIITSDHGDEFNEHGGLSHRDKMYSELIDTPLFIYGTGRNGECDALVSNVDISPTITHLFGADPAPNWEGRSFLPLDQSSPKGCFGEAIDQKSKKGGDMDRDIYFYREEDLKIIYRPIENRWEMYDLQVDPSEQNNIVDSHPRAEEMKAILKPRARRWSTDRPGGGGGRPRRPGRGRVFGARK